MTAPSGLQYGGHLPGLVPRRGGMYPDGAAFPLFDCAQGPEDEGRSCDSGMHP